MEFSSTKEMVSAKFLDLIKNETILLLTGASGAGKTVASDLLRTIHPDNYMKIITDTSRNPRPGEKDKIDYNFRSKDEMEIRIAEGKYLEYNIYSGNYYGSSIEAIREVWDNYICIPVIVIDMNGAKAIKKRFPNSKIIFLDRDKNTLIEEIKNRDCSEEEKEKRIARLDVDIDTSRYADIIIKNIKLADTVEMINTAMLLL